MLGKKPPACVHAQQLPMGAGARLVTQEVHVAHHKGNPPCSQEGCGLDEVLEEPTIAF